MKKVTGAWTRMHADHADNNRCDSLAQTAARTQTSSWPDHRSHQKLRLDPGANFVPPKPQAGLFDDLDATGGEDDPG
ncbi:MAG TPA: hypothetical protein VMH28_15880 [Candidatus Acidoferrales bacterium]|nr:hypothetical protein [Candidatus Acidoferrales bacterium]